MNKVFITDKVVDPYIEKDVLGDELSDTLHEDIEVIIVWHKKITKEFTDKLPKLKAMIRYGVGYDVFQDLEYFKQKGIYAVNTPDYGTDEVSDSAIAMIMNIARGISRYDYKCREYRDSWQINTLDYIKRTSDYKLGVIGAGRIGGSVILKANALRFQTHFYDPYLSAGTEKMLGAKRFDTLDELLETCDIISINCPLTDETKAMIDEKFISKMKKGSSLVNTARGAIVKNLDVFYEPLKSGHLNCVNLDVLPNEPAGDGLMLDAWRAKEQWLDGRFIINPHTAFYSDKAEFDMRNKAALNAKRVIEGKKPINIVNGL
ncbi:lactate dehydrogenase [Malaciobacter molluscorum LMG 25693]|uniref:C-terminal binding protein (CtBP), D-isomer-specific 2-hydroxyacid dehydrogenase-related repressor n=1 Tax=Malaciobacter molluscorum LMG 25693 TaxID=870501 RepID=A0A2G1DKW0_9BACT|nr:NAD(P)-dependent oxidoreductase [Malaciobacter molluscorum]AXX92702.1 C-terminal binding protein (CtBP), D-isomer-specific 2-hydroxyacid dehydrogenase-related repressor [Malaciobacter molluscorum LMG 25693]PHO19119.1 lactate dehydrogenase [Malaciobacter molluscorum LMG 25693]RXJ97433.1 lactate dehydrogenase [Malaciobacter molluscorum]